MIFKLFSSLKPFRWPFKFTGKANKAGLKSSTDFSFRSALQNYYAVICECSGDANDADRPIPYDVFSSLASKLYAYAYSPEVTADFGLGK